MSTDGSVVVLAALDDAEIEKRMGDAVRPTRALIACFTSRTHARVQLCGWVSGGEGEGKRSLGKPVLLKGWACVGRPGSGREGEGRRRTRKPVP
eukprot:305485-Chlamydomonas_euryale.AAC.1